MLLTYLHMNIQTGQMIKPYSKHLGTPIVLWQPTITTTAINIVTKISYKNINVHPWIDVTKLVLQVRKERITHTQWHKLTIHTIISNWHSECKFKNKLAKTSLAQVGMQHSPLVSRRTQDITNQLTLPHSWLDSNGGGLDQIICQNLNPQHISPQMSPKIFWCSCTLQVDDD